MKTPFIKNKAIIYLGFCGDIIHVGHINILKKAKKLGYVIVGLISDEAMRTYKGNPFMDYKSRKLIVESIKYVDKVVPQKTLSYKKNLLRYKPDIVIHGDDWKTGVQKNTRDEVLECLKKFHGRLIEPKYTKGISSTLIKKTILK